MKKVYLAVSLDDLQLPMFVAESLTELAAWSGKSKNVLKVAIANKSADKKNKCSYLVQKI